MKTDNTLIAEFMGFERYSNDSFKCPNLYPAVNSMSHGWTTFTSDQLDFATRWDWLMPVVEKIAKMETNDVVLNGEDSYFDSYFPRTFGMINSETKEFMVRINRNPLHQSTTLIEATYKAVVEFIKWYNSQPDHNDLNA